MDTVASFIAALVEKEVWREIQGYPGYRVSSHGNVSGPRSEILARAYSQGYPFVTLRNDGKSKTARIARLVAIEFLGLPPFDGAEVAHNDGVRDNARVDNLRWASRVENQADRRRHGTRLAGSSVFGAKLTEADIPSIRSRIAAGHRYDDIAESYGVSKSTIYQIAKNKIWAHAGGSAWRTS